MGRRFDSPFDAFWIDSGRVRRKAQPDPPTKSAAQRVRFTLEPALNARMDPVSPNSPMAVWAKQWRRQGNLVATGVENLMRRDHRGIVRLGYIAEAELFSPPGYSRPPIIANKEREGHTNSRWSFFGGKCEIQVPRTE